MYTECPGCQTAFRVTAHMLQQAAGHVRCGDCGRAFNALESLSEDPPHGFEGPDAEASARDEEEQALFDTLDDLAGPVNIRIEDTGAEWRVYDDESSDSGGTVDPHSDEADDREDTESVRWYIEDAAPGTQEFLDLPASAGSTREERYDDNSPLPATLDDDNVPTPPVTPQRRAEDQFDPRAPEFDERQVDFALSEPDDWTDLLEEVGSPRDADGPSMNTELEQTDVRELNDETGDDGAGSEDVVDLPSDIDTQFDLQALEMGIDLTGDFDLTGDQPIVDDAVMETSNEQGLVTDPAADWPTRELAEEDGDAPTLAADPGEDGGEIADREPTGEFEGRIAQAAAAFADKDADGDNDGSAATTAVAQGDTEPGRPEHYVPPQTEEEKTINMLIDRDLLRLAQQEDVFRSTSRDARKVTEQATQVETIIMEGEFVRHALEQAPPAIDIPADIAIEGGRSLKDTLVTNKERIRAAGRRLVAPRYALVAGVAMLALLFAAQVVHAYRETLATYGAFNETVGSLYRLLGAPLVPDWDISGWQFEATSGGTAADDQVLAITSSIANRSEHALPYPLLHVSVTDRWEEIIGSRVLEPDEYLADNSNPHDTVTPGNKFTAVITIASLSPAATGFKLNVCYRVSGDQVRCATGAFKD
ncbi:MAG: zinc-ribbon and DUF3426 domain-containing protein [Woeseiaceae bacterium]